MKSIKKLFSILLLSVVLFSISDFNQAKAVVSGTNGTVAIKSTIYTTGSQVSSTAAWQVNGTFLCTAINSSTSANWGTGVGIVAMNDNLTVKQTLKSSSNPTSYGDSKVTNVTVGNISPKYFRVSWSLYRPQ